MFLCLIGSYESVSFDKDDSHIYNYICIYWVRNKQDLNVDFMILFLVFPCDRDAMSKTKFSISINLRSHLMNRELVSVEFNNCFIARGLEEYKTHSL